MRMKTLQLIFRDSPSFVLKEVILSGDAGAHPSEQAGVRLSSHKLKKKNYESSYELNKLL